MVGKIITVNNCVNKLQGVSLITRNLCCLLVDPFPCVPESAWNFIRLRQVLLCLQCYLKEINVSAIRISFGARLLIMNFCIYGGELVVIKFPYRGFMLCGGV